MKSFTKYDRSQLITLLRECPVSEKEVGLAKARLEADLGARRFMKEGPIESSDLFDALVRLTIIAESGRFSPVARMLAAFGRVLLEEIYRRGEYCNHYHYAVHERDVAIFRLMAGEDPAES